MDNEMEVMQTTIMHLQERVNLAEAVDKTKAMDSVISTVVTEKLDTEEDTNLNADEEKMSS